VTTPGVALVGTGNEGRELARSINDFFADEITARNTSQPRLGFFGSLPDWQDVDGVLAELDYLFGEQRLSWGVVVSSSYGDKLLGDPLFEPIWERLNEYKALVFLHPTLLPGVQPEYINGGLPGPIVDFPLATTRSAVDIVFTGTLRRNPDVDIILSHAGGTVPFVGSRALSSLVIPEVGDTAQVTLAEAQEDFARFYYDIALSTSAAQLNGLLDFTEPSQVLFGTDFPYAPQVGITALLLQYEAFVASNPRGHLISDDVLHENALRLLRKHLPRNGNCTLAGL
jgi:6-methylsalicylate decarboxylase